jgi:hypothetical protein
MSLISYNNKILLDPYSTSLGGNTYQYESRGGKNHRKSKVNKKRRNSKKKRISKKKRFLFF